MEFKSLYNSNFKSLHIFCARWVGNSDDASDIAQESFIELMHKMEGGEVVKRPLAWVFKVAYNRCINHYKFNKRFVVENINGFENQVTTDDYNLEKEKIIRVRMAIGNLRSKEKALVTLYKLGFSYAEMASIVEMKPSSVGKTLTRAIDKLAKWLK